MARIRTVKPDFYSSGKQLRLSIEAAFLIPFLWCNSDDEGRMIDDPLEIGARCPRLMDQTDSLLNELAASNWLIRYEVDGKRYIQIHDWYHQHINRPTPSKIPAVLSDYMATHGGLTEDSRRTHGGLTGERKGKEGKGKEGKDTHVPFGTTVLSEIVSQWNDFAVKNGLNRVREISKSRAAKLNHRLKEGPFAENLPAVFDQISKSDFLLGRVGGRGWKVSFDWLIDNDKNYLKVLEGVYFKNKGSANLSTAANWAHKGEVSTNG